MSALSPGVDTHSFLSAFIHLLGCPNLHSTIEAKGAL